MDTNEALSRKAFLLIAILYWLSGVHIFMHNPGGSGLYLTFNMIGWIFISLLLGLGLWFITVRQVLTLPRSFIWYGISLLVLSIPWFAHTEIAPDLGLAKMLGLVGGLLLIFCLHQLKLNAEERRQLMYVLLGSVLIEILFGLVQYFLLGQGNWIGYNTIINRPYGIFQKDSVLSSFVASGVVLAMYLSQYDWQAKSHPLLKWMLAATLFLGAMMLVLIQSRSGQYGALVGGLCMLLALLVAQPKKALLAFILILVGISIGLWLIHLNNTERPLENYEATIGYRLLYWKHCLAMFWEHPWLGYGYGKFEAAFVNSYYAVPQPISGVPLIEENLDHPHNEILYWLVEGGLVAVLGLALFLWGWFRTVLRHGWVKRLALFALPLPLLFHALVEYPFYHSLAHWVFLMWLFWFTAEESPDDAKEIPCRYWFLLRVLAIVIPLILVPFMATGLQTAWLVTKYERGRGQEPMLLQQVINPVPWYTRYMYDLMMLQLNIGLQNKDTKLLNAYIDWATQFVQVQPRSNIYFNVALAYTAMGQEDKAATWRSLGTRLFPGDPLFKPKASAAVTP